jgi:uncharacterized protein YndB with AHSA1/START domain
MAKDFHISRSTQIAAPAERVHALINDFHEWQKWSPWEGRDPQMERTYAGPESGVGATYAWRGNSQAGQGRMEIVESEPNHVAIDLVFAAPMRATNRIDFTLTPGADSTGVEWAMTGPQNIVMRVMGRFFSMEKMVGPDFQKGLAQLRSVAETGTP